MVAHLGCAVVCGIVRRLTVVCTAMVHRCANRTGTAEVLAAHPPLAGAARAWGAQCRIRGLKAVEACSPWIQTIRYIFGSCRRLYCGL